MLPNKAVFNYIDLITIYKENDLYNINDEFCASGVSIDTRDISAGNIFIALRGENQDGHNRVHEAFEKGASAAVVSKDWYADNQDKLLHNSLIIVDDTLNALGKFAKYHRLRFNIPIIAIGGANGKTTTKEITGFLLAKKFNVLKTFENFNNQLGLPLMLLQLDDSYDVAVLEIGTSEPGEIYILSAMLQPTSGLITNIGKEHLENLIDLDGVEMEETALFAYLLKNEGVAFINYDDKRLKNYTKIMENVFTFGTDDNCSLTYKVNLDDSLNANLILQYKKEEISVNLKIKGYTNAQNAAAAATIALNHGLSLSETAEYLSEFENTGSFSHSYGRMSVEHIGNITLINDCYNANPDSMQAAFTNISMIQSNALKIAVLGDMKELGEASQPEHIAILKNATEIFDKILIYGKEFLTAHLFIQQNLSESENSIKSEKILNFEDKNLINNFLQNELTSGKDPKILLIKGSRSMKMESIIDFVKTNFSK